MLTCDENIRELAKSEIIGTMSKLEGPMGFQDALNALLAYDNKFLQRSWLSKIALSAKHLFKDQDITICAQFDDCSGIFKTGIVTDPGSDTTLFCSKNKYLISKFLHKAVAMKHYQK